MNIALLKMTGSDAVAVFLRAAEGMEPKIAAAFIQAIETIRVRVHADTIARLLERRDYTSLENAFSGHFTSTEWQPYGQAIQQAVIAGTKATSETQGIVNGAQEDFEIRVGLNPRLEQFALTMTSTRIREIDQTTRDTIRQVIQSGTTAGDDPFAIARRIRGSIGLTRRQEAAVNNYERMLRALDPTVLERKLRDRRSDPTVARAISNDKALTDAQVRSLVDRYRDRYIKYRANVIGRTESIRAVQGAQWELFQDMINKGQIDARQVRRTWITTNDGHVRDAHMQIPSMNPRGVGQAETFSSPLGPILYPGDPSALAANTIQCRCAVFARIISRGLLPSSPGAIVAPPPPSPPIRVGAPPVLAVTDQERRRRVWANKSADERFNVAPAFMETDPARMAIIEKLGSLGGVRFLSLTEKDYGGAWYSDDWSDILKRPTTQITMTERDTASSGYQAIMRHEYGHHIDYVMEREFAKRSGMTISKTHNRAGMSRLAYKEIAQDAEEIFDKNSRINPQSVFRGAVSAPVNDVFRGVAEDARQAAWSTLSRIRRAARKAGKDEEAAQSAHIDQLLADRKLGTRAEFEAVFPSAKSGDAQQNAEQIVALIASYDVKDHVYLMDSADFSRPAGGPLAGLSDSLGAATGSRVVYFYAHSQTEYYDVKLYWDKQKTLGDDLLRTAAKSITKEIPQYVAPSPASLQILQYGTGTPKQLFANWFEAWTSGNRTQIALFEQMFPRTTAAFEKLVNEALK
jgi:hypothetical protein